MLRLPHPMIVRICKLSLVAAVAFFLTLVVFNNLTDYDSLRKLPNKASRARFHLN
jgi:hypothetical protein